MPKCELTHVSPASEMIFLSSEPLYFASAPKPSSAYPTGEHSSMLWKPTAANCLRVPGKSLAIISRTGQVWHPIGMPSALARSCTTLADRKPAATVCTAAILQNSLLESVGIDASLSQRLDICTS